MNVINVPIAEVLAGKHNGLLQMCLDCGIYSFAVLGETPAMAICHARGCMVELRLMRISIGCWDMWAEVEYHLNPPLPAAYLIKQTLGSAERGGIRHHELEALMHQTWAEQYEHILQSMADRRRYLESARGQHLSNN